MSLPPFFTKVNLLEQLGALLSKQQQQQAYLQDQHAHASSYLQDDPSCFLSPLPLSNNTNETDSDIYEPNSVCTTGRERIATTINTNSSSSCLLPQLASHHAVSRESIGIKIKTERQNAVLLRAAYNERDSVPKQSQPFRKSKDIDQQFKGSRYKSSLNQSIVSSNSNQSPNTSRVSSPQAHLFSSKLSVIKSVRTGNPTANLVQLSEMSHQELIKLSFQQGKAIRAYKDRLKNISEVIEPYRRNVELMIVMVNGINKKGNKDKIEEPADQKDSQQSDTNRHSSSDKQYRHINHKYHNQPSHYSNRNNGSPEINYNSSMVKQTGTQTEPQLPYQPILMAQQEIISLHIISKAATKKVTQLDAQVKKLKTKVQLMSQVLGRNLIGTEGVAEDQADLKLLVEAIKKHRGNAVAQIQKQWSQQSGMRQGDYDRWKANQNTAVQSARNNDSSSNGNKADNQSKQKKNKFASNSQKSLSYQNSPKVYNPSYIIYHSPQLITSLIDQPSSMNPSFILLIRSLLNSRWINCLRCVSEGWPSLRSLPRFIAFAFSFLSTHTVKQPEMIVKYVAARVNQDVSAKVMQTLLKVRTGYKAGKNNKGQQSTNYGSHSKVDQSDSNSSTHIACHLEFQTVREFLLDNYEEDELFYYLLCRSILLNPSSIQASYDPTIHLPYEATKQLLSAFLPLIHDTSTIQLVLRHLHSKKKMKHNRLYIRAEYVLRVLLLLYRKRKVKVWEAINDGFATAIQITSDHVTMGPNPVGSATDALKKNQNGEQGYKLSNVQQQQPQRQSRQKQHRNTYLSIGNSLISLAPPMSFGTFRSLLLQNYSIPLSEIGQMYASTTAIWEINGAGASSTLTETTFSQMPQNRMTFFQCFMASCGQRILIADVMDWARKAEAQIAKTIRYVGREGMTVGEVASNQQYATVSSSVAPTPMTSRLHHHARHTTPHQLDSSSAHQPLLSLLLTRLSPSTIYSPFSTCELINQYEWLQAEEPWERGSQDEATKCVRFMADIMEEWKWSRGILGSQILGEPHERKEDHNNNKGTEIHATNKTNLNVLNQTKNFVPNSNKSAIGNRKAPKQNKPSNQTNTNYLSEYLSLSKRILILTIDHFNRIAGQSQLQEQRINRAAIRITRAAKRMLYRKYWLVKKGLETGKLTEVMLEAKKSNQTSAKDIQKDIQKDSKKDHSRDNSQTNSRNNSPEKTKRNTKS